ncbi:hypothetical protein BASA81_003686 [Batrachochytrium salamandrivorans]|nr:hypothetical protein BASA81_003686 [Batrachochytrium salamandrivorans]
MLVLAKRTALMSTLAVGGGGALWYYNQDETSQLLVRNRVLGGKRAIRTGVCWLRLVAKYKYLARSRPEPSAGEEEKQAFKLRKHECHMAGAQLVLKLCQVNGGMFTKLGQHAASLRPAIPDEYIDTLTLLQDRAPHRPIEQVIAVLHRELKDKDKVLELVEGIDPIPLGSASLAQVHRCKLRNGKEIALKVQHLDLENIMESDLLVIKALDWAATKMFPDEDYSLAWAVTEFEQNLKQELNFTREADNGMKMRQLIASHSWLRSRVIVPEVDYTRSTSKILSYEFADGNRIRDCPPLLKPAMSEIVIQLFAAMIFTFGLVHCDPHFGNFLIHKSDNRLVLLDHGLYRELDEKFQLSHARLWRAMVTGANKQKIHSAAQDMGCAKYADLFPLMLTNRPTSSSAKLGEPIPKHELIEARKRSGFDKGMSLAQFTQIAEGVPVDMLFVLRTMHLVKDLHQMLGGNNRERFLAYAKTASCAPDPYPPYWLSMGQWHLIKFNVVFTTYELGVDLKRWWQAHQPDVSGTGRFSLSGMMGEKFDRDLNEGSKRKKRFWDRFKSKQVQ